MSAASPFDLGGRRAIVTGGGSGLGFAIARGLAQAGARVVLNGRNRDTLAKAQEQLREDGLEVDVAAFDVADADAVRAGVAEVQSRLGAIDILVNNAGIQHTSTIAAFPPARWDAVLALNLSAPFHLMQAAIPAMTTSGWGRIINIASAHGLVASPEKSAYVAAKHGLVGLTKVAAIELANTGTTVNAICPGWVLTPLVQAQIDRRAADTGQVPDQVSHTLLTEKQPMAQFTTPESIGALAVFLCSDAARTITGAPLSIDGGWTAT